MLNITDQIHAYHALKAREADTARPQAAALPPKATKPADYFRLMMKRWQNDYVRRILKSGQ